VHILVFLLAINAYFIIFSAYFDRTFRNFLVHKHPSQIINNLNLFVITYSNYSLKKKVYDR